MTESWVKNITVAGIEPVISRPLVFCQTIGPPTLMVLTKAQLQAHRPYC